MIGAFVLTVGNSRVGHTWSEIKGMEINGSLASNALQTDNMSKKRSIFNLP